MISTGNDIVSLNTINIARTKQPNFYSKILSTPESKLYNNTVAAAIPFENFVWLLWSIKESAYKYLKRITPDLIFTPVKVVVDQLQVPADYKSTDFGVNEVTGIGFNNSAAFCATVSFGFDILYSRSFIYNDVICTIVHSNNNFEDTYWGIKWIADARQDNQSSAVREFVLENIHKLPGLNDICISKNEHGIPVLLKGTDKIDSPVSLSHHEHFIAYSFQQF
jgi:phosphopantetheinyl transferase (holo-ACP synthase)